MSFGDTIAQTVLGKPTVPEDTNNAPNVIAEGAAVNTSVGITAHSTFANGNAGLTYSLSADSSAGGFKIDPNTGVVTVADPSKIDFETSPGHVYTITVQATKNSQFSSQQTFTISVTDVAPSTPVDSNAAANTVAEGAATGTAVGITASSTDVNGPGVTWSLTGDTSAGGFTINPVTGVITVADGSKIDYESSPGHAYTVTAQASDGTLTSSQTFTINVSDVGLSTPVDSNAAANSVAEGAANGSTVGITASAVDPGGPATTYSLIGDTSLGGFTINAATGVVTVADGTKIDYESAPGHAYTVTVQAHNGAQNTTQSFTVGVSDVAPSTPTDSNAAANSVVEGAANGSTVGVTASSTDVNGPAVTYSLTGDTSGGGFTINAATGVVTVADSTKIDFETAAGHAYTVTAQASDGTLTSSQTFTIAVTDVPPSTPVDSNAAANTVAEGAANGSTVGITASSTDVNGPAVTYSLVGDTSGGGFTINAATGVVTVADATKIDYESAPGHAYTVTAQASDGTQTSSQTFTIAVSDVPPSTPVDSNAAANSVAEGAANGSTVGVTASSTDVNGPAVSYALVGDTSGGGFTINAATGVVTVADSTKIDYESSPGHAYTVTAQASDGTQTSSQAFVIAVTDVAPSTPVDSNAAANTVAEGAANGSTVGVTASSTDVNGPAVTYSLTGDTSGGGFTINAATGVVTVADSTKIDFESSGGSYTVTAQASDGTQSSSQTFTVAVTDVPPSTPVDSDGASNTVLEGGANGSTVGVTVSSTDVNGPAVTYSLTGDTSGGGFTINAATGVVTVADSTKIDYESAPGHAYTVTAQASDGTFASSQTFTIGVTDSPPSTPVDGDAATNTVAEGPANGSTVGVTASSTDVNGPLVTYSLIGDTSGGGFTINAATGVVTVADSTKIDFESSGGSYTVTAQASDGTQTSSQAFVIAVTDVAPSTPVDSDAAANQVSMNAPVGTHTGVTASSTDVNGPAVTYSLVGDTSGGGFTINAATGVVTVADSSKVIFTSNPTTYDVTVDSSDGTLHSQQTFTIDVIPNTPPVANDDSVAATEAGGLNNGVAGSNPSGNVILGTGAPGDVQDTDAEDASSALTVVAVHTGPEGGSILAGTVGSPLTGAHGTLTLNSNGSYTYLVNQSDAVVQALHTSAETVTDVFNYTISDTGGLQDTATFTVTIHGADDLPQAVADTGTMTEDDAPTSFNVIANDTQDPDHTATNAITVGPGAITVTGPAGETFVNTDATATIVSNQVQVSLVNSHFQQLVLGETATVTVPYTLTGDTGETSTANLVVTVNGVNDVPVAVDDSGTMTEDQSSHAFTVLTNDTLDADHGALNNVTTGTVTNLVAPSGESIDLSDIGVSVNGSNQVVVTLGSDFQHMQDGQSATFDVAYTLHGDQAGDTSSATLHVTVNGVNDAPTAGNFTFNGTNSATGNTDLVVNDPTDGAPDPAGPQKTISASLLSGASDVDGPGPLIVVAGSIATAHGGSVTMQSDGDFIYKPPVGYTGSDSFNYQVSDQNAGASGVGFGTGTVTINVAAPKVWYVNADAGTDGDGSSENPFNTLSHFNGGGGVDAAGDTIFLETATAHYTGGLTLENNEQLISQSAGLVVPDGGGGGGTVTLVAASGANVVVDGGVVLGSGDNIQGVDFGATAGFTLSGSSVGTVHVDDVTSGVINNASGGGVSIGGSSNVLHMDFTSVTTGGGTNGISLTNSSGTFHAHGGTISGASGADVALSGGSVDFTDDGAISDATGTVVSIANMTGGTQAFTGAIGTTVNTDGAISLTSNTGATINFSGGMALSTGASNAFSATGGGTVTVTGTNHLTTTTGTALNISNTTIGASGVTFHDISSSGAASGIILNTTGSSGGLTVTGTTGGTINATGGTITGSTGSGISLTSTSNVSLDHMTVSNSGDDGITGSSVTNFTLKDSTISGNGDSANTDHGLDFTNLLGTSSISNTHLTNNEVDQAHIENSTGTATITFDGVLFQSTGLASAPDGEHGLLFDTHGTASADLNVKNSSFDNLFSNSIDILNDGTGTLETTINNNTFTNVGASGITIAQQNPDSGGAGIVRFNIHDNGTAASPTFLKGSNTGSSSSININQADNTTHSTGGILEGQISNNFIGDDSSTLSASTGGSGIAVSSVAPGTTTVQIDHNTIQGVGADGIFATMGEDSNAAHTMNLTIFNNDVSVTDVNSFDGIFIEGGVLTGDKGTLSLDMHDNTASSVSGNDYTIRQRFLTTDKLLNYGGANNDNAAVQAYFETTKNNTAVDGSWFITNNVSGGGGGFVGTASVPAPTLPSPLLAAAGGVQAASPTPGETNLTQAELDSVVAAAISQWAHAGASAAQLAMLSAITFSVADLVGNTVAEQTPGHIVVDIDAAGHGWFVDSTPGDNSEFTHAQNAAGTDLLTDPTNAAAGHLDLLTTVAHEMGHELGLPDTNAPADDLMYINLVDGERRLPDATDVAQASHNVVAAIEAALPASAQAATAAPIVVGTPGDDIINAGLGGKILLGGGGADNFVFGPDIHLGSSTVPSAQPITHVADYSAAQGDTFDFSALTTAFHAFGIADNALVRAVEDPSGTFAMLQIDTTPHQPAAPNAAPLAAVQNWVSVAQLDGAHAGDAVNVLLDSHLAVHLAQIHVDLLV